MVDLSKGVEYPTLDEFFAVVARSHQQSPRSHLGGSRIGAPCSRQLFYEFHWVAPSTFKPKTYLNFDDGHYSEDKVAGILKQIPGVDLYTRDEKERQISYSDFGGHFGISVDGMILGILQAPLTWHIWEHKCVSEKRFRDFKRKKEKVGEKQTLEEWDETYFGQAQVYMGLSKKKRHYLTVATAGTRDLTSCRTEYQPAKFKALMEKSREIIFSEKPPPPISDKADYYICRWCNFNEHCHGSKIASVNCRTCAHVTAKDDGTWRCEFHDKQLSYTAQTRGCSKHLFNPSLVPFADPVRMDKENNTITYVTPGGKAFTNAETNDWSDWAKGTPSLTSKDLQHLDESLISSEAAFFEAAAVFSPTITSVKKKKKPTHLPELNDDLPNGL